MLFCVEVYVPEKSTAGPSISVDVVYMYCLVSRLRYSAIFVSVFRSYPSWSDCATDELCLRICRKIIQHFCTTLLATQHTRFSAFGRLKIIFDARVDIEYQVSDNIIVLA